jgi:DNA transformation protein
VRRLFGGSGIYAGATMFGLLHDGVIYLKVDARTADAFERENLEPFTYGTKGGRRGVMSYRRMPDRLYDDPDELAQWARAALAAANEVRPKRSKRRATESAGRNQKKRSPRR